jgi:hypothetical protein
MAVDDSTLLRTLLKRLWRARRASPFSPRGAGSLFSTAANLHPYHTIYSFQRHHYTYTSGPCHSLISFRTARRQIAPSNAFAARRHVRRITSLPTPTCVKLKPPTNRNPNHVSHRRTSPQTLKFPSSQIGSARLDAHPSMRLRMHTFVAIDRCTFAAQQHGHPSSRDHPAAEWQKNCPTSGRPIERRQSSRPADACTCMDRRDERRMVSKTNGKSLRHPVFPGGHPSKY